MATLFGDEPTAIPKPKAKKPKAETDGAVQRLFEVYRTAFRRRWNACAMHRLLGCRQCTDIEWRILDAEHEVTPLIHYGRDGKLLKDLKDAWGEDEVARLIHDFFTSSDPQVVRSDYKIQVLFQLAQRLRLNARQGHRPDTRTTENIDAATSAMRRRQ